MQSCAGPAVGETTAPPALVRRLLGDWRVQLAAVVPVALALRSVFFVGFALGDDLGYIGHVTTILNGGYPPLDPLNQYAYRPLLLYLFTAGVAAFGYTDLGVVAPVLLASLATIPIVYAFVRRLIDPGAALWCAVLFAFQPFNVVDSTTMTNDVILSCLVFAALTVFLIAEDAGNPTKMRRLFAAAGALLTSAFLVKMTLVPGLFALGVYSLASLRSRASIVWRGHIVCYAAFAIGLACICGVYYLKTGDPLWQFRSEFHYYATYKPDWYLRGNINYASLMWEYPQSLFGRSGYGSFQYLDHGVLMWLFVPASLWAIVTRRRILSFLVLMAVTVFLFFQFYPQYLTPRYLPLVRQTRYLEMLLPAVVIVVGTALHRLSRRHRVFATVVLVLLLGDFVYEASRRWLMFDDSQQDMRALAAYAGTTIRDTHKALAVDMPASMSLQFYLRDSSVPLVSSEAVPLDDTYVAVGGARSFWWSRDLAFDLKPEDVPPQWVLAYKVPGRRVPWRPTDLRIYYTSSTAPVYTGSTAPVAIEPIGADSVSCRRAGLRQELYPSGFDGAPAQSMDVERIPEIDNDSTLRGAHLEWTSRFYSDGGTYTFETTSDDGSWMYLNDQLLLDNGGVHPARTIRKAVRLRRGSYRFRLRYEDTGGDALLRVRITTSAQTGTGAQAAAIFCLEEPAGQGLGGDASRR